MRLRKRDLPVTAPAEPKPSAASTEPVAMPPEWLALAQQIEALQARLAQLTLETPQAAADPKIEQVLELLQAAPTVQPMTASNSEWVFDVKRGPYNEILNVYARRVPVGGAQPH